MLTHCNLCAGILTYAELSGGMVPFGLRAATTGPILK